MWENLIAFECQILLCSIDEDNDLAFDHIRGSLEKSKLPFENARKGLEAKVGFPFQKTLFLIFQITEFSDTDLESELASLKTRLHGIYGENHDTIARLLEIGAVLSESHVWCMDHTSQLLGSCGRRRRLTRHKSRIKGSTSTQDKATCTHFMAGNKHVNTPLYTCINISKKQIQTFKQSGAIPQDQQIYSSETG